MLGHTYGKLRLHCLLNSTEKYFQAQNCSYLYYKELSLYLFIICTFIIFIYYILYLLYNIFIICTFQPSLANAVSHKTQMQFVDCSQQAVYVVTVLFWRPNWLTRTIIYPLYRLPSVLTKMSHIFNLQVLT